MTFYQKYPQLQEKAFLTEMLIETVFTTMCLEDQEVSKEKVQEIVVTLLANSEGNKFAVNQVS